MPIRRGGHLHALNFSVPTSGSRQPAVVLLSGGLDSATVLAMVRSRGFACHAISFDYGQRHGVELAAARRIARQLGAADHRTIQLDLRAIGGSALTDDLAVPKDRAPLEMAETIPVTYVPARNLIFLSLAAAYAEVIGARDLFIGANSVDYSGYPDCRPAFLRSFQETVNLATKAGTEGDRFVIHAPLSSLSKAQIIRKGIELGVDYSITHSCYDPVDGAACGRCDSCLLRRRGFQEAGVPDPTRYAEVRA
jgi:7-cyano-7-deazaguanine synthase